MYPYPLRLYYVELDNYNMRMIVIKDSYLLLTCILKRSLKGSSIGKGNLNDKYLYSLIFCNCNDNYSY